MKVWARIPGTVDVGFVDIHQLRKHQRKQLRPIRIWRESAPEKGNSTASRVRYGQRCGSENVLRQPERCEGKGIKGRIQRIAQEDG